MKYSVMLHIAGGKLANNLEYNISVEFDFTGLDISQLHAILIDSSSPRVKLATRLRSMKPEELKNLETTGYKCKVSELGIRAARVEISLKDRLNALSKADFIEFMESQYDMSDGEAERIYNKKHNIVNPS